MNLMKINNEINEEFSFLLHLLSVGMEMLPKRFPMRPIRQFLSECVCLASGHIKGKYVYSINIHSLSFFQYI